MFINIAITIVALFIFVIFAALVVGGRYDDMMEQDLETIIVEEIDMEEK